MLPAHGYYLPMGTVTLGARTLLGVVFAVAALTKLTRPSANLETLEGFGVPARLARLGSFALAPAELLVAIGLLLVPTARWAAVGAALLLAAFIAGIANALRQGRTPDCGCFGAFRPTPIGRATLARNGVLLIVALAVIAGGPGPALDRWASTQSTETVLLTIFVVLAALSAVVYRSSPLALDEAPAPASVTPRVRVGQPAPSFALPDAGAELQDLRSLLSPGLPLLMVFGSTTCRPCRDLLPHLARWEATLAERLGVALVLGADGEQALAVSREHSITRVLADPEVSVSRSYGIAATPSAVVLAPDGTVSGGPAIGADAIEDLIRSTLHRDEPMPTPWIETTRAA